MRFPSKLILILIPVDSNLRRFFRHWQDIFRRLFPGIGCSWAKCLKSWLSENVRRDSGTEWVHPSCAQFTAHKNPLNYSNCIGKQFLSIPFNVFFSFRFFYFFFFFFGFWRWRRHTSGDFPVLGFPTIHRGCLGQVLCLISSHFPLPWYSFCFYFCFCFRYFSALAA